MLIAAPTAAARPMVNARSGCKNAAANNGASVETDPSIKPIKAGWTTLSTKSLLCPEDVISRPPRPSLSINAAKGHSSQTPAAIIEF